MVALSILVLLECLDDLEGLLHLGIKGRVAQTQWPSRVRVPPVTPVAFTPACPGPVGTGPGRAFEFSSILIVPPLLLGSSTDRLHRPHAIPQQTNRL